MLLPDVNVFVYAFKEAAPHHVEYRRWLEDLVNGEEAFGISDIVCAGFLRIVTHPSIFQPATATRNALEFVEAVRAAPNCVVISPGIRHWSIFTELCLSVAARGNIVPDAYLAALAIESGSEWITADGDFARFPGLRWRRPFSSS
jgi:toxin-antitoxin system PIN domain toxin